MNFRYRRITPIIALLATLAVSQGYVGMSFAAAAAEPRSNEAGPQQLMGVLSTHDGKPITVNGASAVSGATIPSGATIETPDGVGATIKLGPLGSICVAPNTKLTIEFDRQGNIGTVKVTVTQGCVILNTTKDTTGMVMTPQGTLGQTGPSTAGSIDVCLKQGGATINQGAAVDAGAGASVLDCGAAPAAILPTGWFGGGFKDIAVLAGFGSEIVIPLLLGGDNSSPSAP